MLCFVLENALKLLHPFIPFVTEEIYSNLPVFEGGKKRGSIMVADFPRYNSRMSYKKEARTFEGVMDVIKAVRNMKTAAQCPPSRKVEVYLVTESKRLMKLNEDCILRLAGALQKSETLQKADETAQNTAQNTAQKTPQKSATATKNKKNK